MARQAARKRLHVEVALFETSPGNLTFASAIRLRNRLGALLLLGLAAVLAGCQLPPNPAPRDWASLATVAVDQATMTAPASEARTAMSEALAIHFFALGILADGGLLTFREDAYAGLLPRLASDAAHAAAVARIGQLLAIARDDVPPRWVTEDVRSPRPTHEDRRLGNLLREGDGAVQALLAALAADAPPEAGRVFLRLGEGHALMARSSGKLGQQETLRQVRAMSAALQRAVAALPITREPSRERLAAVLLP